MTGERQIDLFVRANRDAAALPDDRFERIGAKVRCVLCHADGWGTTLPPAQAADFTGRIVRWQHRFSRWQLAHLMDHPWPCSCGLRFRDYGGLWRHIGAPRPEGWGRQGTHEPALTCEVAA